MLTIALRNAFKSYHLLTSSLLEYKACRKNICLLSFLFVYYLQLEKEYKWSLFVSLSGKQKLDKDQWNGPIFFRIRNYYRRSGPFVQFQRDRLTDLWLSGRWWNWSSSEKDLIYLLRLVQHKVWRMPCACQIRPAS